jgi:hypothetical protein
VSATLRTRAGRVVVERLQEFDGSLGPEGLAVALGVPEASTAWAFPDGVVDDGRTERIVVYNPGDERAEVEVHVLPASDEPAPAPQPFRLSIRAGTFAVVDYGAEDRVVPGVEHATLVRATNGVPVVAERVTTQAGEPAGDDPADEEGGGDERVRGDVAAGPGAVVAATRWAFPSSTRGQEAGLRLVVFNPDPERSVPVTLLAAANGREAPADGVRATAVAPGESIALDADGDWRSWVVEAEAPVVVERVLAGEGGVALAAGVGIPSVDGSAPLGRPGER